MITWKSGQNGSQSQRTGRPHAGQFRCASTKQILILPREILIEAKELLDSKSSFKQDAARLAGHRLLADVNSLETRSAMLCLADSAVVRARVGHRQWRLGRNRGLHQISTKLQKAMTGFKQYLTGYADAVNIVKQADSNFGGLAYSTISLFLVVGP